MKSTPLVQNVLVILQEVKRPLSVPDLQNLLATKGLIPNKTTLYRLLERLKSENLIEKVLLNSHTSFYELKIHHHHHFTCIICEKIKCINSNDLEKEIHKLEETLSRKGFSITNHHFSLSGKCLQCNS